VGIIYSGEHAFSWVSHYYSSAFTARMFSPLLRVALYFSPSHLPMKMFLPKPFEPLDKPAFVSRGRTEACSTGQHDQRGV
jgi:hypothetical protein